MGDKEEPSLELPSLFGRKKKVAEPTPEAEPEPAPEATVVIEPVAFAPKAEKPAKEPKAPKPEKPAKEPKPPKEPRDEDWEFKLPPVPGRVAAVVTGILVGILGAFLTWASLQACENFKGTESCGGEGAFLLIFVLLLMILAGGVLLGAWNVGDPKSTSALGVGIVCVVILLLLMEELLDVWMFVVVPVISGLSYAAAHWVTTSFVDENELEPADDLHDVR